MSLAFLESLELGSSGSSEDPAWLVTQRQTALASVQEQGLPTGKTEAWKYTQLRRLLSQPFVKAQTNTGDANQSKQWAEAFLGDEVSFRIFVVNGQPIAWQGNLDGVEITPFKKLFSKSPDTLKSILTKHAHGQHFSALNAALFNDGLCIEVKANTKVKKTLHIVHVSSSGEVPNSSFPRFVVVAGQNSECSLVESYLSKPGAGDMCTAVTEIHLHEGAKLQHLRIVEGYEQSHHVGTLAVIQQRDSQFLSRSVVMGGKLTRVEIDARLSGPGAECNLEGVYHAVGSEHVAHHTLITHEDSHGTSSEDYRGIIDDTAHAVFDGIIVVKPGTKNTSAHQQNHNLLLSDDATVNTKPHLEIDSDDLSASHGATIGALDPDQLFFLRARGLSEDQAKAILTVSFVRTILDKVENKDILKRLLVRFISRLPHDVDIEELSQ